MQRAFIHTILFTVDPHNTVVRDGMLLIEDNSIAYAGPMNEHLITEQTVVVNCEGHFAALPGLIDTHNHSSLIRGVAEQLNLVDWLPVYDLEHRTCTADDAYHAYRLGYLECLRNGTTTVQDMYRYMDKAAQAAGELGLRVFLAPYAADISPYDFFETSSSNEELIRQWHGSFNGRVQVEAGLEDVLYCSASMYQKALEFHDQYGVRIHTHGSEHQEEEVTVQHRFGMSTIQLLQKRGILKDYTSLGHCVPINRADMDLIAQAGAGVCHCAISAAKLGCGTAPIQEMEEAGISVSLGSDGPIDNNSMDLFQEMKVASLMQKVRYQDASICDATHMLRMATIQGARNLGIDYLVGSLEAGKRADIVLVDVQHPSLRPIYWNTNNTESNLIWALVFAMQGSFVDTVLVDGNVLIEHGHAVNVDEHTIIEQAQEQGERWMARRNGAKGQVLQPIRNN